MDGIHSEPAVHHMFVIMTSGNVKEAQRPQKDNQIAQSCFTVSNVINERDQSRDVDG